MKPLIINVCRPQTEQVDQITIPPPTPLVGECKPLETYRTWDVM